MPGRPIEADAAAVAALARSGDDFATLTCGPWDAAATVHLRLRIGDTGYSWETNAIVLRALAVVVTASEDNRSGVFDGCVLRRQAVDSGKRRMQAAGTRATDNTEALTTWFQDARAALLGSGSGDGNVEYVYSLTRGDDDDDGTAPRLLEFTWKPKLPQFDRVPSGYVYLSREQYDGGMGLLGQVSSLMLRPVINELRSERDRQLAFNRDAEESRRRLVEDNQRLLDQLRSATRRRAA